MVRVISSRSLATGATCSSSTAKGGFNSAILISNGPLQSRPMKADQQFGQTRVLAASAAAALPFLQLGLALFPFWMNLLAFHL
ncbi:unnamed protein product [Boreogadus saida]